MEKHAGKEKKESPAKKYLKRIQICDDKINAKLAEIDDLYDLATRITPYMRDNAGASSGGNQDKLGNAVAKIADLKAEANREIDTLIDLKREISAKLDRLENPDHRKVLRLRYISNYTFEMIAMEMNYSYRGVCYLHGRALTAFEKIMHEGEG